MGHSPLGVAHHAAAGTFFNARKLAAGYERGLGGARISALCRHQIGKVQSTALNPNQGLAGGRRGVRDVAEFKDFGASQAGDDNRFHREECSRQVAGKL